MTSLNALGRKYGTDKASNGHNYLYTYEKLLAKFKDEPITLIEIGCYFGSSLNMWAEYFPKARIIGLDIETERVEVLFDRIKVLPCDCSKLHPLQKIAEKQAPTIIVDDGSHCWSHQMLAFETCFPHLRKGGVYICEDLQTSFGVYRSSIYSDAAVDSASYFSLLALLLLGNLSTQHPVLLQVPDDMKKLAAMIDNISFIHKAVIIHKK